jgi:hypothetical protein
MFVQIKVLGLKIRSSQFASEIGRIQEQGCRVRMGITSERGNGIYRVHDLFVEHNHILHTAQTSYLMPS